MTEPRPPEPTSRRIDYEVGYGRPPVASRFKLGNRCNPRGRPKRKKTVSELIEEAMNKKVKIVVEGRSVTMTKQQVIIHNLVNSAARSDHKAMKTLFSLMARYQDSPATTIAPAELGLNDQEIIEEFMANSTPAKPETAPVEGSPRKDEAQPVEGTQEENQAQPIEPSRDNENGSDES